MFVRSPEHPSLHYHPSELWWATKDTSYLDQARAIANAVIASPDLTQEGILTELCEATGDCNKDQQVFKGIFARNLAGLNRVLEGDPYRKYLMQNARSAYEKASNATGFYDVSWRGPFTASSLGTQASAASLFVSLI